MSVEKATKASAVGTQVLVELLTAQEVMGSSLHFAKNVQMDTPQGFVLSVGPMVPENFGVKLGDRVFFSSPAAVFPPIDCGEGREQACIEYTSIKGVLS